MKHLLTLTAILPLAAACTHDIEAFEQIDVQPARDLDVLYVFDNSIDRGSYDQMASQLGDLTTQLASVDGQLPSLHVGVVTTDLGTRGAADTQDNPTSGRCRGRGDAGQLATFNAGLDFGNFLEDVRGTGGNRIRNFGGDVAAQLARLTSPVMDENMGCEFPQSFEAMKRALDPAVNPGFVRPDALLSVVFLSSQDDCSLARGEMITSNDATLGPATPFRCTEQGVVCDEPDPRNPGAHTNCRPRDDSRFVTKVSDYQAYLTGLKADAKDVTVAAVAGPRTSFQVADVGLPVLLPSCQGGGGPAMPAVRIGALVDAFGGAVVDGCTQASAYQQIAAPIVARQRSCFANLRQSDGDDCVVTQTVAGVATELPRCGDGAAQPCWSLYADATACPAGDHVGVAIDRGPSAAPAGATVTAKCVAH